MSVVSNGQRHLLTNEQLRQLRFRRGFFWTTISVQVGRELRLSGLPNAAARAVMQEVRNVWHRQQFRTYFRHIRAWLNEVRLVTEMVEKEHRWFTFELQQELLDKRAALNIDPKKLNDLFKTPVVQNMLSDLAPRVAAPLREWGADWPARWRQRNQAHMGRERLACADLLGRVESRALNDEQAEAVICFDNRLQLVASAGSGKTSTMVAKAIYAVHRKLVKPSDIIMLAFNKEAADELEARATASLVRLGMGGISIAAKTFHSLGLSIIGGATNSRPNVPKWTREPEAGLQKLAQIVDDLKGQRADFRSRWDLFRLVFGRDIGSASVDEVAEAFDQKGRGRLVTLLGEHVESQEERWIANWLFYNGVSYVYEKAYEHNTATATHRQYRPDFYYPQLALYHEHFALDGNGKPPAHFKDYQAGVNWKRKLHRDKGTELIETTSHQMAKGDIFDHLTHELCSRGVVLDPDPNRPIPKSGLVPMEHKELLTVMRAFIAHYKSNSLSIHDLRDRLNNLPIGTFRYRYQLFLELALPVIAGWDAALKKEDGIDFEDMIKKAAEYLEQGYPSPYRLVMADEYQDASHARARLCRALVRKPHSHLFAVGDDWQSINRFAGADISVMTEFRDWFGYAEKLRLKETYRCPQDICDASSRFVSKNPAQDSKSVVSQTQPIGVSFQAFQVAGRDDVQGGITHYLDKLHLGLKDGTIPDAGKRKVTVFVLGRYKADVKYVPVDWEHRYGSRLAIAFRTIHTSKGDEADYVILPGMVKGGFPNTRGDDPVFSLVMPEGDHYPLGEERRLFYVAMTRARRSLVMFTTSGRNSPFLTELVNDGVVIVTDLEGQRIQEHRCPVCKYGVIVARTSKYGDYLSCSSFPRCRHKPKEQMEGTKGGYPTLAPRP